MLSFISLLFFFLYFVFFFVKIRLAHLLRPQSYILSLIFFVVLKLEIWHTHLLRPQSYIKVCYHLDISNEIFFFLFFVSDFLLWYPFLFLCFNCLIFFTSIGLKNYAWKTDRTIFFFFFLPDIYIFLYYTILTISMGGIYFTC